VVCWQYAAIIPLIREVYYLAIKDPDNARANIL